MYNITGKYFLLDFSFSISIVNSLSFTDTKDISR